jgi:kynurenine formamidase
MNKPVSLLACLLLTWSTTVPAGSAETRVVDLTYPFSAETVYWPTAHGFELQVDSRGHTEKGYYYEANSFRAAEHGGTHVDAPIHFAEGKATVDEIPLERLMAPGVLVDVSAKTGDNADYLVSVADLEGWEKQHGRIPDGVILLLRTGWGDFYPDRKKYLGTDGRGPEAVPHLHFPGLAPEAATWLVAERRIAAIGLDTASIDHGPSKLFRSHQILFEAEIPAFENVAHLDRLPAKGFRIIALPMKIQGGSGGPLRIVAVME